MRIVQDVSVEPTSRRVWRAGEEIRLARKEFDLLWLLISNPGEIVSRERLMREVWHANFWTSSKTIDVHLGWLRRKLGDPPRRPSLITTHRGKGLRFELHDARAAELDQRRAASTAPAEVAATG